MPVSRARPVTPLRPCAELFRRASASTKRSDFAARGPSGSTVSTVSRGPGRHGSTQTRARGRRSRRRTLPDARRRRSRPEPAARRKARVGARTRDGPGRDLRPRPRARAADGGAGAGADCARADADGLDAVRSSSWRTGDHRGRINWGGSLLSLRDERRKAVRLLVAVLAIAEPAPRSAGE